MYLAGDRSTLDLTRLIVEEFGLRPGLFLDDLQLARLRDRNAFQEILDRALHFLENRPRSEREIRTRLAEKGTPSALLDRVVERLRELGLIDDGAFAQYWIENRERFSPRGARALKAELLRKGLTAEVVAEQIEGAIDEEASARTVALRQARRLAGLDRPTFRQKLWAHLARRGFDYEAINRAIDEAWQTVTSASETESEESG